MRRTAQAERRLERPGGHVRARGQGPVRHARPTGRRGGRGGELGGSIGLNPWKFDDDSRAAEGVRCGGACFMVHFLRVAAVLGPEHEYDGDSGSHGYLSLAAE